MSGVRFWNDKNKRLLSKCSYLFSTVWGQIEHKYGEEGDAHTRDDKVNGIKKRFPSHRYIKCDVKVRLITACVKFFIPATEGNENR